MPPALAYCCLALQCSVLHLSTAVTAAANLLPPFLSHRGGLYVVSVSRMFGAAFFSEVLENSHLCYPRLDLGREKEGVNFILLSTKADSVSCTLLGAPNLSEAAYLVIFSVTLRNGRNFCISLTEMLVIYCVGYP